MVSIQKKRFKSSRLRDFRRVDCVIDGYSYDSFVADWNDEGWKDGAKLPNGNGEAYERAQQSTDGDWDESCTGKILIKPEKAQMVVES